MEAEIQTKPSLMEKADPTRLRSHVARLTETQKPRNYLNREILNEVALYIRSEWQKERLAVEFQTFRAGGKEYKNILTSLGPQQGPRIVIGAHYDVAGDGIGADDNASGVAGLLELARLLKRHSSELQYRVDLVAYCLEEPPFFATEEMGSVAHAQSLKEQNISVALMISLEMIGYFDSQKNSQQFPLEFLKYIYPTTGNFIAVVGKLDDVFMTRKVKALMKKNSEIDVQFINAPESLLGVDLSDHRSYWKLGYPAVMVTDTAFFRNPNYHTTMDTIETLDFVKMAEVVNGVLGVIQGWSGKPKRAL